MRDVLTEEECREIMRGGGTVEGQLETAARLGAERARESIAKWMDAQAEKIAAKEPYLNEDDTANKARAWDAKLYAVAIRRGEGEQA